MSKDKDSGFHPTHPSPDDTNPMMEVPNDVPPPEEDGPPETQVSTPTQLTPPEADDVPETQIPASTQSMTPSPFPTDPPTLPGERVTPQTLPPAPVVVKQTSVWLWVIATCALVVAIVSLTINALLVSELLERQKAFLAMFDQSIASVDDSSGAVLKFNFPVSQTVNFEGDIPFQQDFDFPFKGNVRIQTTIRVQGPLGTYIDVPVDQTVPVDTSVPVHIDQTFHIKTQVPVKMEVPVEVKTGEPPFSDWMRQLKEWLIVVRNLIA